jgi:predicted glycogen debranching enzyme
MHESEVLNRMPWAKDNPELDRLLTREWLVTNGLGGYAAGTVAGALTRRFHGMLVASLPAPLGRLMMLNHVSEEMRLPNGEIVRLSGEESSDGQLALHGPKALSEFRLESGLPFWRFEAGGFVVEKSLVLPHLQNTVFIRYRMLSGRGSVRLRIRPSLHFRPHEGKVDVPMDAAYSVRCHAGRYEIKAPEGMPPLRMLAYGPHAAFVLDAGSFRTIFYRVEKSRGYDAQGTLWSPGYLRADLAPGTDATLAASTETWETFAAMQPHEAFSTESARRRRLVTQAHPKARTGPAAEWILAADQFLITPNTRVVDAARMRAAGDDIRTIIAGYHWFTDWGRDSMISLEGLALATGRHVEAGYLLRMFARHLRDGLIPNYFPEGRRDGVYHTADATLWFFHALSRYLEYTVDRGTLLSLLPALEEILRRHREGTRFGIRMDPLDALLTQGEEGYQLTWMDAKVGDWVVTPRRGKAVEINALWYNALRLMEHWLRQEKGASAAEPYAQLAARTRASFNARFWNPERGYLRDVVDGSPKDSEALRPNQIFALSLPYPVLETEHWEPVLESVRRELLTPFGLRSLAPGHPDYRKRYDGDLRSRDAAYHQGTVWSWLIGPFIDAWLRVHPADKEGARKFLQAFVDHLGEACLGSVSEIFDAEEPYTPRGCVAQAWSVAEVLRSWIKTAE